MNASPLPKTPTPNSESPQNLVNATVPTADLLDYSNWSAAVRQQMLKALERRQQEEQECDSCEGKYSKT